MAETGTARLQELAEGAFGGRRRLPGPLALDGDGWQADAWPLDGRWRPGDRCVVVLGAFDGVHGGHRALLAAARARASALGVPLVAMTFDPDPSAVVGRPQESLLPCEDRRRWLAAAPVDGIVSFRFTPELADLDHRSFLVGPVAGVAAPVEVHVGEGFRLGRGGAGTVERLQEDGAALGYRVVAEPLAVVGGAPVSATRVRSLLDEGDVLQASALLGRPPVVRGTVVHGRGEGAGLGFPTANIEVTPGSACPRSGVYAGIVRVGRDAWPAAVNAGKPPTFTDEEERGFLEAMLLGFSGDLYGRDVEVALLEPLRASRPFTSVEGLQRAVEGNIEQVRSLLGDRPVRLREDGAASPAVC